MISHIIQGYRQLLFHCLPWTCLACDEALNDNNETHIGLCFACQKGVLAMLAPHCQICGISLSSESEICLSCRGFGTALPGVDLMRSVYLYGGTGPEILHAYKYSGGLPIAGFFAATLTPLLRQFWQAGTRIITVPSLPANIRRRGYDQMAKIVQNLAQDYRQAYMPKVFIRRNGIAQKSLTRQERSNNLQGRIQLKTGIQIPKRVILLDDVCTTGATLSLCAQILRSAGCREIIALTLFRD